MKIKTILGTGAQLILWTPVIFFSLLLSHNAILYFTHGGEYGILPEKIEARKDIIWNIALYTHLPTGIICLMTPFILFAFRYFRYRIAIHKWFGKLYVWTTLLIVCPTGLYLALYAKGGLITQAGFFLQGILLAYYTYQGYRSIFNGNKQDHFHFMIRSYAVAAVVLTFRIYHILFFILEVPYHNNYAISQWLGLFGNLLIAEVIIFLTIKKQSHLNTSNYETA